MAFIPCREFFRSFAVKHDLYELTRQLEDIRRVYETEIDVTELKHMASRRSGTCNDELNGPFLPMTASHPPTDNAFMEFEILPTAIPGYAL